MRARSTRWLAATAVLIAGCGDRTGLLVELAPIASTTTAPLVCDANAPDHAAPCATVGRVCVYASPATGECGAEAGVASTSIWRCERDGWSETARCIDTTACPSAQPKIGDPCDAALEGVDCFYSTAACDVAGIERCSGGHFQGVNDCGARSVATCALKTTSATEQSSPIALDGQTVGLTMATAGVEDLVGGVAFDGEDALTFRAAPFDSHAAVAAALPVANLEVAYDSALRDGPSVATAVLDRWWILSPSDDVGGGVGVDLESARVDGRRTVLDGTSHRFGPSKSTPVSLAMTPLAGWAAYLAPSAKPSTSQLVLMPLDGAGAPAGDAIVVDDEAPTSAVAYPVAHAAGAVARRGDGFVAAFTVPANGDFGDDSGVQIVFIDDASSHALPTSSADRVRLAIGPVGQVAIAPLADGAVLVATTVSSTSPPTTLRLARVERSGSTATLPSVTVAAPATIDAGIRAFPFDDGFVLAWPTLGGAAPSSLHVAVSDAHATDLAERWTLDRSAAFFGPFAITVAPTDASIHVAYFDSPAEGEQLLLARAYCAQSP